MTFIHFDLSLCLEKKKLMMAFFAILMVVKMIKVKLMFLLPLLLGVGTAKKMFLKLLLFIFPAFTHIFKFCAYYHAAHTKFHHHHHQVSRATCYVVLVRMGPTSSYFSSSDMLGTGDVHTGFWWGNLRERDNLEDPGVDRRIISRWIFKKWVAGAWTG